MTDRLMKAKHWQIFLGWLLLFWLYSLVDHKGYPILFTIARVLLYIAYFGWFLLLERTLKAYLPSGSNVSSSLFIGCIAFLVGAIGYGALVATPGESIPVEGFVALPFLFAFFYLPYHLGKLLATVEHRKAINFGRHFGETILFLFYPLGMWLLQPRINELYTRQRIEEPHGS